MSRVLSLSPAAVTAGQARPCDVVGYDSRVPAGAKSGIVLIEMKTETYNSEAAAKAKLKEEIQFLFVTKFDQVGVDHSEDEEAVALGASELNAIIGGTVKVGSISGYVDGKTMYAFYIENEAGTGLPRNTSDFAFELIDLVQKSKNHKLADVLKEEPTLFDTKWQVTNTSVLSCT